MIEDFLIDLVKPIKAIELLTILLEELITEELMFDVNKNQYEKNENTLTVNYVINLVNNDMRKLRKKYYKLMCKEKYSR